MVLADAPATLLDGQLFLQKPQPQTLDDVNGFCEHRPGSRFAGTLPLMQESIWLRCRRDGASDLTKTTWYTPSKKNQRW